ncbi:MAG: type II secretion system F family protein, partial [Candidatus Saccharimonadales bacterium]
MAKTFVYVGTDKAGKPTKGDVSAMAKGDALNMLHARGVRVTSIKEKSGLSSINIGTPRVSGRELVVFTRQLATLINAGVALPRSLVILQAQAQSQAMREQLAEVMSKVEGGSPLADALGEHPNTFNSVYVNMVRAGEEGGILDEVLNRVALQQEKDASIKKKIKSAMTYPTVVFSITILIFIFLMTTIVPKLGGIILDLGGPDAKLPAVTTVLLAISGVMTNPLFFVPVVIAIPVIIFFFRRWVKTKKGRYAWHAILLKTPLAGALITKVALARFARTFASLMHAGVPVLQALSTTASALGNAVIEKALLDSAQTVQSGGSLSEALAGTKLFP